MQELSRQLATVQAAAADAALKSQQKRLVLVQVSVYRTTIGLALPAGQHTQEHYSRRECQQTGLVATKKNPDQSYVAHLRYFCGQQSAVLHAK